jgi:hypothetical protein
LTNLVAVCCRLLPVKSAKEVLCSDSCGPTKTQVCRSRSTGFARFPKNYREINSTICINSRTNVKEIVVLSVRKESRDRVPPFAGIFAQQQLLALVQIFLRFVIEIQVRKSIESFIVLWKAYHTLFQTNDTPIDHRQNFSIRHVPIRGFRGRRRRRRTAVVITVRI